MFDADAAVESGLIGGTSVEAVEDPARLVLRSRLNGKAWHDRKLTADELAVLARISHGQPSQMLDVLLFDLVQGDNTRECVTLSVPRSYPPLVQNIDLVVRKQRRSGSLSTAKSLWFESCHIHTAT